MDKEDVIFSVLDTLQIWQYLAMAYITLLFNVGGATVDSLITSRLLKYLSLPIATTVVTRAIQMICYLFLIIIALY